MADFCDMASERESITRQEALARARRPPLTGESLECCCLCGADIPEARRLAIPGVGLCVTCQKTREEQ